jgi:hypothetical protein
MSGYTVSSQHTWEAQLWLVNFSCMFLNPNIISNLDSNCSNLLDMRNLQEQVKKAFCYQKLFWPFTVWINCSSDLKNFANYGPSALNFKSFNWSLEQFFLTVGQNNFGIKIPFCSITKMGADYSFELISIETYTPEFNGHNKLFLGSVLRLHLVKTQDILGQGISIVS